MKHESHYRYIRRLVNEHIVETNRVVYLHFQIRKPSGQLFAHEDASIRFKIFEAARPVPEQIEIQFQEVSEAVFRFCIVIA